MQLYRRPPEPPGFPTRGWETAKQKAERIIEEKLKKMTKTRGRGVSQTSPGKVRGKKKEIFPALWKNYKALFAYAQFEKCGFCESNILTTSYGDVEHYRPKSEISELDQSGRQLEASASITERKVKLFSSTGYYWLAYDWSNYLLACSICNGPYKGTLFPVKDSPRANPPLKTRPSENPLLLNPFDNKDPANHLRFQRDGFVLAKSPFGRATIETCGLARFPLVTARGKIAMRVYLLAPDLKRSPRQRRDPQAWHHCYEAGADDAEYCGMVRCIIKDVTGLSWEKFVTKYAQELALQLKATKAAQKRRDLDVDMEKMCRERYEHAAAVREIFERVCGLSWEKLVSRRARQLASDFLALKTDWKNDPEYELSLKRNLYLMARDNPSHARAMKEAYESQCRLDWDELKAAVEDRFELLWKL